MSPIDAVVVAVLLIGALFGLIRGAIRQLVNAAAWVASAIIPYYLAGPVGHIIANRFDAPYGVAYVVGAIALAILSQLVARFVIAGIGKVLGRIYDRVTTVGKTDEERAQQEMTRIRGSIPDRLLGAIIGGTKWAAVAWVLLSGVALLAKPLREKGFKVSVDGAESYKLAEHYNAFRIIWAQDLTRLSTAMKRLSSSPARTAHQSVAERELRHDERVKKLLTDRGLQDALSSGDFTVLMSSPQVLSLLTDPTTMAEVLKVNMERENTLPAALNDD